MKKTGKALQRRACLRGNTFHAKGSDPVTKETIMKTKATKKKQESRRRQGYRLREPEQHPGSLQGTGSHHEGGLDQRRFLGLPKALSKPPSRISYRAAMPGKGRPRIETKAPRSAIRGGPLVVLLDGADGDLELLAAMAAEDRLLLLEGLAAVGTLQQQLRFAALADLLFRVLRLEGAVFTDVERHQCLRHFVSSVYPVCSVYSVKSPSFPL